MRQSPPDLLIEAFGGVRATARALEIDHAAVSRWRLRGRIPSAQYQRILGVAERLCLDITAYDLVWGRQT